MKMAQYSGASEIIAIGTKGDDKRLELAKSYGATITINSSKEDALPKILSLGDGYGADLIVDTAGVAETLKLSMDSVRPNGQITKIGWGPKPVNFSLDQLIAKSVTFKGHFSHTWDVWEKCLTMMSKGQIDLENLITHELPIDQWEEAFELVENKEAVKAVLIPMD
jgi:alcohol dehydrogenase/L-iditol 2-dehydrogenase